MFGWTIVSKEKLALGQRVLRFGLNGRDVHELQKILIRLGLYEGVIDGNYGLMTEEAVADLEKAMGLRADGILDLRFIRLIKRDLLEGGWIVHRVQGGETFRSIGDRYQVKRPAFSGSRMLIPGKTLLIPRRNFWVWHYECKPGFLCTGRLTAAREKSQEKDDERLPLIQVIEVGDESIEKDIDIKKRDDGWVMDARRGKQSAIRRAIHRAARRKKEEKPWIWLSDLMLEVPGASTFFELQNGSDRCRMIIELSPPRGSTHKKNRPGYAWMREWKEWPLMYSLNLSPRLELDEERRLISFKEARLWRYRSPYDQVQHLGRFQWAMIPICDGDRKGRLWYVDAQTMNAVYRSIIQDFRSGIVLEGLNGVDPRLIKIYQDYFAIGNNGHEIMLQDIYLKREKVFS